MIVPMARKARKNATANQRVPDMRSPSGAFNPYAGELPPDIGANLSWTGLEGVAQTERQAAEPQPNG
jgi:hypothetical protein